MKLCDKLAAIEERTAQTAMLQAAQSFDACNAHFYAVMLDALADRGAIKRGCDELQRLAKEYSEPAPAPESEPESAPTWADDMSDAAALNVIMWEVFQTAPRAWRTPGGASALLKALRAEDEAVAGMSNSELKALLDKDLIRLSKMKP
jgi:hypothetical protein